MAILKAINAQDSGRERFIEMVHYISNPAKTMDGDDSQNISDFQLDTFVNRFLHGQQKRKPFGFSFRTDVGDDEDSVVDPNTDYKLHLWYNCTAKPSDRQYQTINESPEAITFSWEIETTPIAFRSQTYADLLPTASLTIDSRQFTDTNASKLTALLEVLYGTAASGNTAAVEGYLPTPDAVLDILSTGTKPADADIDRGN